MYGARMLRLDSISSSFRVVSESYLFCSTWCNTWLVLTDICNPVQLQIFLPIYPYLWIKNYLSFCQRVVSQKNEYDLWNCHEKTSRNHFTIWKTKQKVIFYPTIMAHGVTIWGHDRHEKNWDRWDHRSRTFQHQCKDIFCCFAVNNE